jgi:hypothetical protein
MGGVQITDKDNGYDAVIKAFRRSLKKGAVKVGVDARPHEPTGQPTDEIAAFHEFGQGVPQRSFLRAWVDENPVAIHDKMAECCAGQLNGGPDWRVPFGAWAIAEIKARIEKNIPPPLAPSTVKRKGSSVPLIDTEQLINAIISELEAT